MSASFRSADIAARLAAARDVHLLDEALRQQIYLGMRPFDERTQGLVKLRRTAAREILKAQPGRMRGSLGQLLSACDAREEAAHTESSFTIRDIAMEFGLSVSRISRLNAREEGTKGKITLLLSNKLQQRTAIVRHRKVLVLVAVNQC